MTSEVPVVSVFGTFSIATEFEFLDMATVCVADVVGVHVGIGDAASTVFVRVLTD